MRKLSDGILPCGRCGVEPEWGSGYGGYWLSCPCCEETMGGVIVADTIVDWNTLSAATHPEPEDYLELLEECLWKLKDDDTIPHDMVCLLYDLRRDYGDDDD